MRSSVPGVHIPDAIVERIEQAGTLKEQKAVGKQLCVELIQEIREIPGVHGVHLMAYRQEEFVSEIIQASGVLQGFRLALLKDGGLAVGKRTLSTGNKGSYFSWGGQSYGSYDAPDVETWTWLKLARTAAGDSEPPVIDAYVPGATAP